MDVRNMFDAASVIVNIFIGEKFDRAFILLCTQYQGTIKGYTFPFEPFTTILQSSIVK